MARLLGVNKSGFYHYFGDREIFFFELMEHHCRVTEEFTNEIRLLKNFDPDYYLLLIRFQLSLFFQMQLRLHMQIPMYREVFNRVKEINDKAIVGIWSEYLKIPNDPLLALQIWEILRDVFFLRVTRENMNVEFIRNLVVKFKDIVEKLHHSNGLTKRVP
jgi:AcrR family transcriptional regulator